MALLKKLFSLSFRPMKLKDMIVTVLAYMAINLGCGLVLGLLAALLVFLPLVSELLTLLSALPALYSLVGVVLTSLHFFDIL